MRSGTSSGLASPASLRGGASCGTASVAGIPFDTKYATTASTMFAMPAAIRVPGRPIAGISMKPEASTPSTAPRLFRK